MKKYSAATIEKFLITDDGVFPNHASLPVLLYRNVFSQSEKNRDTAADIEEIFAENNWKNAWRNGIYDYHHYHSITHEVLGIYGGCATVQLGGEGGIAIEINKSDVLIIPAGVAHKNLSSDKDFQCVGAYPNGSDYDLNYGKENERPAADENISQVVLPANDPVFGFDGPLLEYWK